MPSYDEYMKNKRKKKQGNTQNQNNGHMSYDEWVRSKGNQTTVDLPTKDTTFESNPGVISMDIFGLDGCYATYNPEKKHSKYLT